MSRLVEALQALGVEGDVALSGRWVTIAGERCRVQVVEASWGTGYYGWCDDPAERTVRRYPDAATAIRDGLRRAAGRDTEAERTTDDEHQRRDPQGDSEAGDEAGRERNKEAAQWRQPA